MELVFHIQRQRRHLQLLGHHTRHLARRAQQHSRTTSCLHQHPRPDVQCDDRGEQGFVHRRWREGPEQRRRRTRTLSSSSPRSRSWRPLGASIESLPSPGLGSHLRAQQLESLQPTCSHFVRSKSSEKHSVRDSIREDALPALRTPCPASFQLCLRFAIGIQVFPQAIWIPGWMIRSCCCTPLSTSGQVARLESCPFASHPCLFLISTSSKPARTRGPGPATGRASNLEVVYAPEAQLWDGIQPEAGGCSWHELMVGRSHLWCAFSDSCRCM